MKNKKFKVLVLLTGAAIARPTYKYFKGLWDKFKFKSVKLDVEEFCESHKDTIELLNETMESTSKVAEKKIEGNLIKLKKLREKLEMLKKQRISRKTEVSELISFEIPDYDIEISEIQENFSFEISDIKEVSYCSVIEDESSTSFRNNKLLKMYDPKIKTTWRLQSLTKLIEKVLNNKFKDDFSLLDKSKEPLTMSEYLISLLFKESPTLAEKKICEVLNTFRSLQSNPQVKFYCRLFQVFEPNPISYKLSLYIIKMRYFFNVFIGKQVIPESHKKRVDKMQVTVILKTTRKLFNSDIETGRVVLKYLKPENISNIVWTVTCIEYYLYYKNILPIDCFNAITNKRTITETEFVNGLSKLHETYVNEFDLRDLFSSQCTGLMTVEEFTKLFDLDSFFKRNQTYMVDQIQFLNALVEGYTAMRIRHYKEVENIIVNKCGKKQVLTKVDACKVLGELGASTGLEKVFGDVEEFLARDLKRKIFELNIGGKGIGCYNLKSIERISDVFED